MQEMDRLDYTTPPSVDVDCQPITERALRAACLMLHDGSPALVTKVALSMGLRNAREAWGIRALADELAAAYGLCADVRANDDRILVRISRPNTSPGAEGR
jgi:hypothetical protein